MFYIIEARKLKPGDWIRNGRLAPLHVVSVEWTRDAEIKVRHDFGNGGEPATSFYRHDETVVLT